MIVRMNRMIYDEHMHDIYYSIVTDTRDSLYVSLLMADQILETTVDVKMLGNVLTKPQKFKVEVVGERTDAKEGIHYEKLPEFYEFPAGEFIYKMPVRLIKGDAAIKQKPVTLTLRLVATGELGVAYADKSEIRLLIADMLKKPEGEGYYGDMTAFKKLFGEYSQKKHMMIIEMTDMIFGKILMAVDMVIMALFTRKIITLPMPENCIRSLPGVKSGMKPVK